MSPQAIKTAKTVSIVAGAIVASLTLFGFARPVIISDNPPWASIERVKMTDDDIRAVIIRGNIIGAWGRCREAMRDGNFQEAQSQAQIMSALQGEYAILTGGIEWFPPSPCP